jgi:hypothetical protein
MQQKVFLGSRDCRYGVACILMCQCSEFGPAYQARRLLHGCLNRHKHRWYVCIPKSADSISSWFHSSNARRTETDVFIFARRNQIGDGAGFWPHHCDHPLRPRNKVPHQDLQSWVSQIQRTSLPRVLGCCQPRHYQHTRGFGASRVTAQSTVAFPQGAFPWACRLWFNKGQKPHFIMLFWAVLS